MKARRVNYNSLIKLIDKYYIEADRCLKAGAYLASLVIIRGALESILLARFLVGLMDLSDKELEKIGVMIEEDNITIPSEVRLKKLIEAAYDLRLVRKSGYEAAERIRKWGNKIHPTQVAKERKVPAITRRNVEARFKDLNIVTDQLMKTL